MTVTSAVFTSASGPQRTSWVLRAAGLIEKDVVRVTADPFSGVAVTVMDAAPGTAPAAMSKRAVASPGRLKDERRGEHACAQSLGQA